MDRSHDFILKSLTTIIKENTYTTLNTGQMLKDKRCLYQTVIFVQWII